ncbi:MAG TPA: hypothetical protein VK826_15580, partial [Bacteroidia bacterium]|nr:hypothetical protein [Bacteroidia bacterium]
MKANRKNYLLLLHHPSAEAARHAWSVCRQLNIPVPIQHGNTALEVLATPDEVEALFRYGIFATQTARKLAKDQLEKMSPHAQEIAAMWNQQFSADYQRRKKDKSLHGLKYNSPGKKEPAPYVDVDIRQFKKLLDEELRQRKTDPSKIKPLLKVDHKRISAETFLKVKNYIGEQLGSDKEAYQLSRMFYRMKETDRAMFLSPDLLRIMQTVYRATKSGGSQGGPAGGPTGACRKMHGRNSVGIVFVESSKAGGPKFTTTTRNEILNEIKAGLSWLVVKHPSNDLSWTFDVQNTKIDVANKANKDALDVEFDDYWREPAMGKVKFDGKTYLADDAAIDDYRNDMMEEHDSVASIVIFVTPYGSSWHAYSTGERFIVLAEHGDEWGDWGQDDLNLITA